MANEKRLIDANALGRDSFHIREYGYDGERCVVDWDDIESAPTVDAVEVVRCKECKNYEAGYVRRDHGWCKEWGTAVRASGFCHHGERRADG